MKVEDLVGKVIKIHDSVGIVMKGERDAILCHWGDGRIEWLFLPNYSKRNMQILTPDKKCP